MTTLDDFFGCTEVACVDCGTTENLTGIGWDAVEQRPIQYICQSCQSKRDAKRAQEQAEYQAHLDILDDIDRTDG